MSERTARKIAAELSGEIWNSGGGIHLVVLRRADGRVVAISDDVACEYESEEAMMTGEPVSSLALR
ncbi:MAG: hypothetical protein ACREJD_07865 [Phycisphaerales bacterium]